MEGGGLMKYDPPWKDWEDERLTSYTVEDYTAIVIIALVAIGLVRVFGG